MTCPLHDICDKKVSYEYYKMHCSHHGTMYESCKFYQKVVEKKLTPSGWVIFLERELGDEEGD
ncbi:hypothetical protein DRO97_07590 [Archaeoglobales archaeon]|nr:MAG: hypothetical protein DRO97_07590 [Archaeoglobales archaeon]